MKPGHLARIFHELLSRDHEDGRATGQPYRGIGPEAYLSCTSQGEPVLPVPSVVAGSLSKERPRTLGRMAISVVAVTPGREFMKLPG
jgi:hypothetical protein